MRDLDNWVEINPVDVTLGTDDPWRAHLLRLPYWQQFIAAIAQMMPGRRPADLLKSKYARLCEAEQIIGRSDTGKACAALARMIDDMIHNGFRKGSEWNADYPVRDWQIGPPHWYGPITMGIAANGTLAHHDGIHRTIVATLLGLDLPIRIVAHAKAWQPIHYRASAENQLYDWFGHPEFASRTPQRPNSAARFAKVLEWIRLVRVGRVVDIGSNCGHWPAIASKFYTVCAIERNDLFRLLMQSWLIAVGGEFEIKSSWQGVAISPSDVVTSFAVVHHIEPDRLQSFIDKITRAKAVVIESPPNSSTLWKPEHPQHPWDFIHQRILAQGFKATVLHVDTKRENRQTVAYRRNL